MTVDHNHFDTLVTVVFQHIPVGEAALPCGDDALGQAARAALDAIRRPLSRALLRRVGDLYSPSSPSGDLR